MPRPPKACCAGAEIVVPGPGGFKAGPPSPWDAGVGMSQASMPLETSQGYAPPIVTQFSVFLPNRVGKLLDLVESFDPSTCQICAINVHEASDCAIVRLITNISNTARELLLKDKLAFSETDLLVVELSNNHTLSSLCLSLLGAELNIHFAYPLMI